MKVSVLVPIYGVETYIERCVYSLFKQTFADIEYVFVDDCTQDRSIDVLLSVLEKFPQRKYHVKIINHSKNKGLAAARNTALQYAGGDYLLHVDSDDYLELNAIELLYNMAITDRADVVVFDMKKIFPYKTVYCKDVIAENKEEYIRQLLRREVNLGICGKFFHRDIFINHGVRFIEGLNFGEDYVTSPRLMYYASKIVKLDAYLYNYIQYNENSYINTISQKSIDDITSAVDILCGFFSHVVDFQEYVDCFPQIKIRNKIGLLKLADSRQRKIITRLYEDIGYTRNLNIPFFDLLILRLAMGRYWLTLDYYIKFGLWIKRIKRRIL